ncbi:CrcB-like protein-domain-containing protein [Xylaria sp. FL1042]|nr:CrcB-like protein-domain-containing protein [Xylaria sp. FL1042]
MSHAQGQPRDELGESPVDDGDELYFLPGELENLTELGAPAPVEDVDEGPVARRSYLEDEEEQEQEISSRRQSYRRRGDSGRTVHGINNSPGLPSWHHDPFSGRTAGTGDGTMDEVKSEGEDEQEYAVSPALANISDAIPAGLVENPEETPRFSHHNLEEELGRKEEPRPRPESVTTRRKRKRTWIKTQIFIVAHLVFFSILGTLARLGLATLTTYPTGVVSFAHSLWPNFAGTLILGFLSEGSELLHHPRSGRSITRAYPDVADPTPKTRRVGDVEDRAGGGVTTEEDEEKEKEGGKDSAAKSTVEETLAPIPLHIGLASGFCGSFTTFSTFMLDCFKALSGILSTHSGPSPPSPGRDFMAVAGVILITIGLSGAGLKTGAHIAVFMNGFKRRLPRRVMHWLDYVSLVLGLGAWAVAIVLAILAPDAAVDAAWRQILFALALAPVGCLLRFVLSLRMNSLVVGFPLGTFTTNAFGTLVLAVTWDLQRLPGGGGAPSRMLGGLVSCQVLQGVEDGFCGCATTVSTWILELAALKRRHAYRYGLVTLAVGLGIFCVVSGSLKWTVGLVQPVCTTL